MVERQRWERWIGNGIIGLSCSAILAASHGEGAAQPTANEPQDPPANSQAAGAPATSGVGSDASAQQLVGTSWTAVDSLVQPRRLDFGTTTLTSHTGGTATVAWVDFSGTHPACLGFPRCVIEVRPDGTAIPMFFAGGGGTLYAVDCVRWSVVGDGGPMPSEQQVGEQSGVQVIWRNGDVMCLHLGRPMYQAEIR